VPIRTTVERMNRGIDIYRIQTRIFHRHRWPIFLTAMALYAGGILIFGPSLRISSNYLVALPVIAAALGFGFWGGFSAGMLGLPANLMLFAIIGHPEFSPESKLIAEIFGITVGGSMGALGDYFKILNEEIQANRQMAVELSQQISDREVLIQEVHHRVKNNLTLILSLLQLQRNQNDSEDFRSAMEIVTARIRAIASAHDHIYTHETSTSVNLKRHLPALCRAIIDSQNIPSLTFHHDIQFKSGISLQKATPLSLIILEIITNSCKHAFPTEQKEPRIFLYGRESDGEFILIISDNGHASAVQGDGGGLGSTIIRALAKQLRASLIVNTDKGYEYVIKIQKFGIPARKPSPPRESASELPSAELSDPRNQAPDTTSRRS
jgi:two-component sensor histidine kinase